MYYMMKYILTTTTHVSFLLIEREREIEKRKRESSREEKRERGKRAREGEKRERKERESSVGLEKKRERRERALEG